MSLSISVFSILLLIIIGFSAYRIALEESQEIIDRQMQEMAQFLDRNNLSERLSTYNPAKLYDETDLFIDIVLRDTLNTLTRQHNYILPYATEPHFVNKETSRGELKIYVLPLGDKQIQISQLIEVRRHLAEELAFNMLLPYLFFMPFGIYAVYRLIRHHLRAINTLSHTFAKRDYHDLSEIHVKGLPTELIATVDELNSLFQRIQNAQNQQQLFIANAAHELRTPLTALNLQISLLARAAPESLIYQETFDDLKNSVKRMTHLIEQLMDLAHHETQKPLSLQALDLAAYTQRNLDQLMINAQHKNIKVSLEIKAEISALNVLATAMALDSILTNLIDNAIKYSPDMSDILISLSRSDTYVILDIHDSGQGIPAEKYQHVMQRFVRLIEHRHLAMGSGLGLSIVQSALDAIEADIHFERSDQLKGLKVRLFFQPTR